MSIQVAHVVIGLSKGIAARAPNQPRLGGVLTDAVFDWADSQPAITGVTWSLWPDTYPALIVLSPYKLSKEQGLSLAKGIEIALKRNHWWGGNLNVLWSYRLGEVRLFISDDEYRNDSCDATTNLWNQTDAILSAVGDTRLNSKVD
jgi:hypothetical protein